MFGNKNHYRKRIAQTASLFAAKLKANKTLRCSAELSTFTTASADKENNLSSTR